MSGVPRFAANARAAGIVKVALLAVGQAVAAGIAAFSTRDVFASISTSQHPNIITPLLLIVCSGVAIAVFRVSERVLAERIGQDFAAELRSRLFKHFSRLPASVVNSNRQGAIALRFVGDLSAVRNWVSLGIARLISSLIVLPAASVVLYLLHPVLGLAALVPVLIGLAGMAVISLRLDGVHRRLRGRRGGLAINMTERLPHAPELRLMGRMAREHRRLSRDTEKMVEIALQRVRGAAILQAIPDAVTGITIAILLFAAFQANVSTAEAAGAIAAVGLMIKPMRDLASVGDRYRAWNAARAKLVKVFSRQRIRRSPEPHKVLPVKPLQVEFVDVTAPGIRGLDTLIEPGQKVALVGGCGMEASTLLALVAGLEPVTSGQVLLAGRAPVNLSVAECSRSITYIGRSSPILAGSLRRALTMGVATKPPDPMIQSTAEAFGLQATLTRLGGLQGRVAEAGRNLSSGEIRRIMLVRAALSESQLLLLDEPELSLGTSGPELIMQLIKSTAATTLIATHNPEVARQMDRIWQLPGSAPMLADVGMRCSLPSPR